MQALLESSVVPFHVQQLDTRAGSNGGQVQVVNAHLAGGVGWGWRLAADVSMVAGASCSGEGWGQPQAHEQLLGHWLPVSLESEPVACVIAGANYRSVQWPRLVTRVGIWAHKQLWRPWISVCICLAAKASLHVPTGVGQGSQGWCAAQAQPPKPGSSRRWQGESRKGLRQLLSANVKTLG